MESRGYFKLVSKSYIKATDLFPTDCLSYLRVKRQHFGHVHCRIL